MNNIDTSLIGTYIKNVRLSKGWSQAKLEYISGISASSISNIEHVNKGIFYNILNDSGFLSYIGDQQFSNYKSQIYIKNEELINLFNRLSPSDQQSIIKEIRQRVEETEKLKQKNMFKKL